MLFEITIRVRVDVASERAATVQADELAGRVEACLMQNDGPYLGEARVQLQPIKE